MFSIGFVGNNSGLSKSGVGVMIVYGLCKKIRQVTHWSAYLGSFLPLL